ncbi:SDR family NAD(P)-dependent oxidoreductase, partial [Tistrella mobilis]
MKIDLTDRSAVVTGSTAGIGHAIARGLAGAGASVVLNGRHQPDVDQAVAALKQTVPGAEVRGVAADLGTEAGCDTLAGESHLKIPGSGMVRDGFFIRFQGGTDAISD